MTARETNVLSGSFGKDLEIARNQFEWSGIHFDPATGVLTGVNSSAKLEPKAADVLSLLLARRGTLVPRQRLLDECWGEGAGSDEALTQAIAQIRRALEALGAPRDLLTTYPKRGYRLAAADSSSQRSHARRTINMAWIVFAAVAALLLSTIVMAPHWPRHVIRHALGLGPNHTQHH